VVVEGGPTPTAPVDGPVVPCGCVLACEGVLSWPELVVPEDELGVGVTVVGDVAVELAVDDGVVAVLVAPAVVAAAVDAVEVLLVDEVEVDVEPIVEVDPVVPAGAFAAANVSAVTISPLLGVRERNEEALGAWRFASAFPAFASECAARKLTACGGAITMPIEAANCSIRWSSPSVATLERRAALRPDSVVFCSRARPMLAPSLRTSTCIATIPASITPSTGIHQRPRTRRSSSL
jgi:hypothetical protein